MTGYEGASVVEKWITILDDDVADFDLSTEDGRVGFRQRVHGYTLTRADLLRAVAARLGVKVPGNCSKGEALRAITSVVIAAGSAREAAAVKDRVLAAYAAASGRRLTVMVTAEILSGRVDPSSVATFANASRAGQYAQLLADGGGYSGVYVTDAQGGRWEVLPTH